MMYTKRKKLLSVLLAVSLTCTFCLPDNFITIFAASDTPVPASFNYSTNDITWNVTVNGTTAELSIANIINSGLTELQVPSINDINSKLSKEFTSLSLSTDISNQLSKFTKVYIKDGLSVIPTGLFQGNETIDEIRIDATNTDITLSSKCFSEMSGLKTVTINSSATLEGSVFAGCKNVTSITFNKTVLSGGYNFDGCTSLANVQFNNQTTFSSSKAEFTKDSLKNATVLFKGAVTNTGVVFDQCPSVNTISLQGSQNTLEKDFLTKSTVTNFNIENETTLKSASLDNSTLEKLSINNKTHFYNGSLYNMTVTNMYFNTDNRDQVPNLTYNTKEDRLGYCSTVKNLYFNYKDINQNTHIFQVLKDFPLGDTPDTSLNCDAIYFMTPNMKYIDALSTYDRCDGVKPTTVYGYGGASCTDDKGNRISSYQMFKEWSKNSKNVTFQNFVTGSTTLQKTTVIYLPETETSCTYDFASPENFTVTGTYPYETPYDDVNNRLDENLSMELELTTDNDVSSNFSYRILEKTTKYNGPVADQYVYEYNNNYYVPISTPVVTLAKGNHQFILEVGGEVVKAFNINVVNQSIKEISEVTTKSGSELVVNYGECVDKDQLKVKVQYTNGQYDYLTSDQFELEGDKILSEQQSVLVKVMDAAENYLTSTIDVKGRLLTSIASVSPVTGTSINLTYGETVTKDMLVVKAKYSTGEVETLLPSQYELGNTQITANNNIVKISTNNCSPETISADYIVYGFPNQITGFRVSCDLDILPENATLTTKDVHLTNITYANPSQESPSQIDSGFRFIVNGVEAESVVIQPGENHISVIYGNYVLENAICITGKEAAITKVEASYIGDGVYEGQHLELNNSQLQVNVYKEGQEGSIPVTDYSQITLSDYQIIANQNNKVTVFYKGIQAAEPILVPGLKDEVAEISTVRYNGYNIKGTQLKVEDFYVELRLLSGTSMNSLEHPELLQAVSLSTTVLYADVNVITVYYNKTLAKSITILAFDSGNVVITPPPTDTPQTSSPTVTATVTPSASPDLIQQTKTPVVTETLPPLSTQGPTSSPVADGPVIKTDQPAPTSTAVTVTDTNVPNDTSVPSNLRKGSSYYVNNIRYKIVSTTADNLTVSIIGYKKSAKKITIPSAVTIDGVSFDVVTIANSAFKNCTQLKGTLKLGNKITTIGKQAFCGCTKIKKLIIGEKVYSIGAKSFYNCSGLSQVNLCSASKLSKVGKAAFKKNSNSRRFKINSGTKAFFSKLLKGKY